MMTAQQTIHQHTNPTATDDAVEQTAMDVVLDALAELADDHVRARVLRWVTDELARREAATRYVAAALASSRPETRADRDQTRASRHHEFAEEFQRLAAGPKRRRSVR